MREKTVQQIAARPVRRAPVAGVRATGQVAGGRCCRRPPARLRRSGHSREVAGQAVLGARRRAAPSV
ncbi:hypothetical protein ACFCW6_26600 [Streptomyces sp. NPDC056333]|uniref:hypothetical protein n=1 Tax=Streptomyces sp. NPDC056333 TaxID=3345786 RepID=UPI0035D82626